jgi:hypothetical protein
MVGNAWLAESALRVAREMINDLAMTDAILAKLR